MFGLQVWHYQPSVRHHQIDRCKHCKVAIGKQKYAVSQKFANVAIGNQKYAINQKYDAFASESPGPWSWLAFSTGAVSIGAKTRAGLADVESTGGLLLAAGLP